MGQVAEHLPGECKKTPEFKTPVLPNFFKKNLLSYLSKQKYSIQTINKHHAFVIPR
jgi:hypothetical protein